MEGRTDLEKYPNASHIQQNFIPLLQGPAMYRPGCPYVATSKFPAAIAAKGEVIRFEFSATQAFIIEFDGLADGSQSIVRFYTLHAPLLIQNAPAYNNGTTYAIGAAVLSGGLTYYCIQQASGFPPAASPLHWYPMSAYNGSATTAIYEIPCPIPVADMVDSQGQFTLQIVQSGDVLYIAAGQAGPGHRPYTLTRFSNAPPQWIFAPYFPTDGPFADKLPLVPNGNIVLGVSEVQGNAITVSAFGGNVFAPTDVGRLVRIQSQVYNTTPWTFNVAIGKGKYASNAGNNYLALNAGGGVGSGPTHTAGAVFDGAGGCLWLYVDSGYGVAQITAYTSPTQVSAKVLTRFPINVVATVAAITGISQANPCVVTAANSFEAGDPVFLTGIQGMTDLNGNWYTVTVATGGNFTLDAVDSTGFGAYSSGGNACNNTSTEWQLGAWSDTSEWPRAVAFFKDRAFWAGNLKLWGSVPGLYASHAPDNFGQVQTDSAINVNLPSSDASGILWLAEAVVLLIGTPGGEYGLDAANYTGPLGPANVEILRQSRHRVRPHTPQISGATVLYTQRAGRKVEAMDYNFYLNRYDSVDQSKYAYHITIGGLAGIAYMAEPFSVLWARRTDGVLLSFTYNREDAVAGWSWHTLGGSGACQSIAQIPAPDGLRDELWMKVQRNLGGVLVNTIEYMAKYFEGPVAGNPGDDPKSCFYVDCGFTAIAPAPGGVGPTILSGLPLFLAGQTLNIFADGGVQPKQLVSSSGTVSIPGSFGMVTVGFGYQGNLVPMRFEGGADVGTAQGKLKNGSNLALRVVDTIGGSYGKLSSRLYKPGTRSISVPKLLPLFLNDASTVLDQARPPYSGDLVLQLPQGADTRQDQTDNYLLVQQNDPCPMTVVGVYPSYKVEEYQ